MTYVVKVALNGSMPSAIVNKVATETPMCVGTARDTFYKRESAFLLPLGPRRPTFSLTLSPSPL